MRTLITTYLSVFFSLTAIAESGQLKTTDAGGGSATTITGSASGTGITGTGATGGGAGAANMQIPTALQAQVQQMLGSGGQNVDIQTLMKQLQDSSAAEKDAIDQINKEIQ